MTKYIPLEELEKIIANIEKFYADNHWVIRVLKRDIEFIETIDPVATIDEMIEEEQNWFADLYKETVIDRLQE